MRKAGIGKCDLEQMSKIYLPYFSASAEAVPEERPFFWALIRYFRKYLIRELVSAKK